MIKQGRPSVIKFIFSYNRREISPLDGSDNSSSLIEQYLEYERLDSGRVLVNFNKFTSYVIVLGEFEIIWVKNICMNIIADISDCTMNNVYLVETTK